MASAALRSFLKYPHGTSIEGINYKEARFVMCPKCWVKYIYIYGILIIAILNTLFVIETGSLGTNVVLITFTIFCLSISEILMSRLLPGTKNCQDIPFPPQSDETLGVANFIHLAFKYTPEESKARFLRAYTPDAESETDSDDSIFSQKTSEVEQMSRDLFSNVCREDSENSLRSQGFERQCKSEDAQIRRLLPEGEYGSKALQLCKPEHKGGLLPQSAFKRYSKVDMSRKPLSEESAATRDKSSPSKRKPETKSSSPNILMIDLESFLQNMSVVQTDFSRSTISEESAATRDKSSISPRKPETKSNSPHVSVIDLESLLREMSEDDVQTYLSHSPLSDEYIRYKSPSSKNKPETKSSSPHILVIDLESLLREMSHAQNDLSRSSLSEETAATGDKPPSSKRKPETKSSPHISVIDLNSLLGHKSEEEFEAELLRNLLPKEELAPVRRPVARIRIHQISE